MQLQFFFLNNYQNMDIIVRFLLQIGILKLLAEIDEEELANKLSCFYCEAIPKNPKRSISPNIIRIQWN